MATLNLSITVDDAQMLSDVQSILDNYVGETYEEKLKTFLKSELLQKVNEKRRNNYNSNFTYEDNIEK